MRKVHVIISVTFVLALFAGAMVGALSARLPESHEARSWMTDQLDLSPEQREQMRAIWSELSKNRPRESESRRAVEKQRTDEIVALLSPEQKAKYDAINQSFSQKLQDLSKQREQALADAQEKTRQILSPQQWAKYEQLMQKRRENSRRGGMGGAATEPSASMK